MNVFLTQEEILIINNALNEILNGLDMPDLETRIGTTREQVEKLLEKINKL
jgi:hypothetical protein